MTISIDLPNSALEMLERTANRKGIKTEKAAAEILIDTLEGEERERQEMMEGVERGLAAFEAGRHRPFEEFAYE